MVAAPTLVAGYSVLATGSTVIIEGFKILYKVASSINDFIDEHIEKLKNHENSTVSRTGRVLELAKIGFGIGYITPVVVITVGQLLLGVPLQALETLVTAATLSNPIAMTCAAVGALYYGWSALSDLEKQEVIDKINHGLQVGEELVKSIINFVINKTKEFWESENLNEIKKYIKEVAVMFGKTLGDITHKVMDIIIDSSVLVKDKTTEIIIDAYEGAKEKSEKAADILSESIESLKEYGGKIVVKIISKENQNKSESQQGTDTLV